MPKLKSCKGAVKRFIKKANGRIKHRQADRNHILTKKSTKRKRQLRKDKHLAEADRKIVDRLIDVS